MRAARLAWPVLAGAVALAAALAACGHKQVTAPRSAPQGPALVAEFPRARSLGVLVDASFALWAQFDRPLDPASVDSTTVFLKIDTRRQPVDISYDSFGHRIVLRPRLTLTLQTTYTVEISAAVRAADGTPLGHLEWWQFSTSSIYGVSNAAPPDRSVEGPHAMLAWSGNAVSNRVRYQIYASSDSSQVARRTAPPLATVTSTYWFPSVTWPAGQTTYWAVSAIDTLTHDVIDGPLGRFTVLPDASPIELDTLTISEWGGNSRTNTRMQYCAETMLPVTVDYNDGIRFPLGANHPDWRVRSASIEVGVLSSTGDMQLGFGTASWNSCQMVYGGAPYVNGTIPVTTTRFTPGAVLQSVQLASFVDTAARYPGWYGFLLRTTGSWAMAVNNPSYVRPRLVLVVQRVTPGPAAARR